jgi:hypothetical protein
VQELLTLLEDMFCNGLYWVLSLVEIVVVMLGLGGGVGGMKCVSFSFPMVMSSCINKSQSSQSSKFGY